MKTFPRFWSSTLVTCVSLTGAFALTIPAHAVPIFVQVGSDYSTTPYTFTVDDSTFTFSATGDEFNPTAVQTSGGAEVNTIFGQPTSNFIDRGTVTFGLGMQFSAFTSPTTIPYSNGDNFIGLLATENGQSFYGYAFTTDTVLDGYAFETIPNTTITASAAVPEPGSWAMFIGGLGVIGGALRGRRKIKSALRPVRL